VQASNHNSTQNTTNKNSGLTKQLIKKTLANKELPTAV